MYNLVDYQAAAVEKLTRSFKELIYSGNPNTQIVFSSPTGSGKTLMIAAMLDELRKENLEHEFVFIWASMNSLPEQSFDKLSKNYLPDSQYKMLMLENITADELQENTILFCNWEKMYQIKRGDSGDKIEFKNVFVSIGENGRNLQEVLNKTRAAGRRVILIVDEAHRTYLGENSQELVKRVIQPDMTIEVSATPILTITAGQQNDNIGRFIEIKLQDVISSGLIKNRTIINNDISGEITNTSADELVLSAAIRQQKVLTEKYVAASTNIKPLILIQLPADNNNDADMRNVVERYLDTHGINYENHKLAIWLSGDKTNKDLIDMPDSPVQVLLFKQAIATGWDCPRAQILVMLRDIKSIVFEIQTIGRILRMPELRHYADDDLNAAYVFTNIRDMSVADTNDARAYFRTYKSKLPENFANITLPDNDYSTRANRKRLGMGFRAILLQKLDTHFGIGTLDLPAVRLKKLDNKLQIYPEELNIPILSNVILDNLDAVDKSRWEHNTANVRADGAYIQRIFNTALSGWVSPYAPFDSIPVLRSSIYKWFTENTFIEEPEVQRILTCSEENQRHFNSVISDAKQEYGRTDGESRDWSKNTFHLPTEMEFGDGYTPVAAPKHILQPYFQSKNVHDTEKAFEPLLDASDKIAWWFRNGVSEPKYFCVAYKWTDPRTGLIETRGFYPDYIVKFVDGRIGIFDTKSGRTAIDAETNAKLGALADYFAAHNALNIFGGIIDVRDKNTTFWLKQSPDGDFTAFVI